MQSPSPFPWRRRLEPKRRGVVHRDRLPPTINYYSQQGLRLVGKGAWQSALCPFHEDHRPSMRVHVISGGFRCMVCGAHGGDIIAFHMQFKGVGFIDAAKDLGIWEKSR